MFKIFNYNLRNDVPCRFLRLAVVVGRTEEISDTSQQSLILFIALINLDILQLSLQLRDIGEEDNGCFGGAH